MAIEFSITRRVEFSETDLAGIMHFTNFYRWMEICEHEFLRSVGLSVDMEDENGRFGWPRVKTSCRFKRPLRFEEQVEVKLIVTEIKCENLNFLSWFVSLNLFIKGINTKFEITNKIATNDIK